MDFSSPTMRRRARRVGRGLLAGAAVAALVLALRGTTPLRIAEWRTYDARVRALAEPEAADSGIVIVEIGEGSLEFYRDALGRWPWPRHVYSNVLRYLDYGGARLAVFDILFREPDLVDPASDSALATAMDETGNAVLAFTFSDGDSAAARRHVESLRRIGQEDPATVLERHAVGAVPDSPTSSETVSDSSTSSEARSSSSRSSAVARFTLAEPPHPIFADPARALGAAVLDSDEDGVARRDRPLYAYGGRLFPSLALAAAREAEPERFGGPIEYGADALRLGETTVPLEDGRFLIRWRGPYRRAGRTTYPIYPIEQVLKSFEQELTGREPDVPPEAFRDKIVFIATSAAATYDLRSTPISPVVPGVMIHASALDNLLTGDYMRRASFTADAAITVGTALLAGVSVAVAGSAVAGGLLTALVLALCLVLNVQLFQAGVWLDLAAPLFAGGLAFAGTMSLNYVTEGRERRRVRDLFSRYVPPDYVQQLADDPKALRLGGERVPLTLLFSDIRGFTSMSERLPPETVVGMLNEYLERMADVVFRHEGTLDKFIGDAVMAFWGAPIAVDDHARRAADTALDMLAELEALNRRWRDAGIDAAMDIGIGINTGEAVVGNIGSLSHKLDYTAIGDAVNLASRLEGLNKEHGTHVLVSDTTRAALGDAYTFRALDEVRVKGKERPVLIHELVGRTQAAEGPPSSSSSRSSRAGALTTIAVALAAASVWAGPAAPVSAQETAADTTKTRWVDWVYQPGRWTDARLVPFATTNPRTDTLAVTAKLDGYSMAPRWRVEIRRVDDGRTLADPLVLVGEGREAWVRSGLGVVALEEHEAADDELVRAIIERFDAQGRPTASGPDRLVDVEGDGRVRRVLFRQPLARTDFEESLLDSGGGSVAGRNVLRLSMDAIGGERDEEVVASAGARGVARVQTIDGEIEVMPDTAAIVRMQGRDVGFVDLDRFLREAGLGPYGDAGSGSGAGAGAGVDVDSDATVDGDAAADANADPDPDGEAREESGA